MERDVSRLFFGLEVEGAWIEPLPKARIVAEEHRHITMAFLGHCSLLRMKEALGSYPEKAVMGPVGKCDKLLFLPARRPNVVAGHVAWLDRESFEEVYQELCGWLLKHKYKLDERPFLPHVTIARGAFRVAEWKKAFSPFLLVARALNLYESLGNSEYRTVWKRPFVLPFEEIEHTADRAYRVRGKTMKELFLHAEGALAFYYPPLMDYFSEGEGLEEIEDVVIALNRVLTSADMELGCPYKAISFHGEAVRDEKGFLLWEMIVDV